MTQKAMISLALVAVFLVPLCGCQPEKPKSRADVLKERAAKMRKERAADKKQTGEDPSLKKIQALATEMDKGVQDGWIAGRDPRVLKTNYRIVSPEDKAKFAVAYNTMLEESGQNLATDFKSYVPYSKRFKFAIDWWKKNRFFKAERSVKKRIRWIHESLLDARELSWRVYEKDNPQKVNSPAVLAHYKEQDMVSKYMDDEKTPGTYSGIFVRWKDKLK